MSLAVQALQRMGLIGVSSKTAHLIPSYIGRSMRRIATDSSGATSGSDAGALSGYFGGSWDVNNRIRTTGAAFAICATVGLLFDTFYRRATKQELKQGFENMDRKFENMDRKFDGL